MAEYKEFEKNHTESKGSAYDTTKKGIKLAPPALKLFAKMKGSKAKPGHLKFFKMLNSGMEIHDIARASGRSEEINEFTDVVFDLMQYSGPVGRAASWSYKGVKLIDKHLTDGAMEDGAYHTMKYLSGSDTAEDQDGGAVERNYTVAASKIYGQYKAGKMPEDRFVNNFSAVIVHTGDPSWFLKNYDLSPEVLGKIAFKSFN